MRSKERSRRSFLIESITGLNAAWAAANSAGILEAQQQISLAARAGQVPRLTFFTDAQAAEIEAMAAQIIPTDETPGAREAHCVYFIDRALSTFAKNSQKTYAKGIEDLQAKKFSILPSGEQIQYLKSIEKTPFFETVRVHTIIGFLSRPVHGGNYDQIGWKLIGYEDTLNHKPPFGYYDAQYEKAKEARR